MNEGSAKSGSERRLIKSCCSVCGHNQCGVLVEVEGGRVKSVMPDRDDPMSGGSICPKGLASADILYHPDRLKQPMLSVGERGDGRWKQVGWDEALRTIAERLTKIRGESGPEAVVFNRGTNRGSWIKLFVRLSRAFGSPNFTEDGGSTCYTPRSFAQVLTLGGRPLEWPDFENSRCILVWGVNPPATWPLKSRKLMLARKRGAKIIVVDPVLGNIASKADIWLPIRPGTDAALLLGFLNVIIWRGLYDRDYVEKYCTGFEALKERAAEYPPSRVAEITWLPEEQIVQAATLFAGSRPASITIANTFDEIGDPIQASRAISILAAITGNVDAAGGNVFPASAGQVSVDSDDFTGIGGLPEEVWKKRLGVGDYPLLSANLGVTEPLAHWPSITRAILTGKPYPVRALYMMGANPVLALANSSQAVEALRKVEFVAVTDLFMTDTARLADVVLPAATWLEQDGLVDSSQATWGPLRVRRKVTTYEEARSDTWIILELAKRLGLPGFWETEKDYLDYILSPLGTTFDALSCGSGVVEAAPVVGRRLAEGFETASGKVELHSKKLEEWGYDPLPFYKEPFESPYSTPELAGEFPLVLTTGRRTSLFFHTAQRNIPVLRDVNPDPIAEINAGTAADLGLAQGDWVLVSTPHGRARFRAKLTEGIHPKVVAVQHGWSGESNDNLLTQNDACAEGIGSTALRGLVCNVRRWRR